MSRIKRGRSLYRADRLARLITGALSSGFRQAYKLSPTCVSMTDRADVVARSWLNVALVASASALPLPSSVAGRSATSITTS